MQRWWGGYICHLEWQNSKSEILTFLLLHLKPYPGGIPERETYRVPMKFPYKRPTTYIQRIIPEKSAPWSRASGAGGQCPCARPHLSGFLRLLPFLFAHAAQFLCRNLLMGSGELGARDPARDSCFSDTGSRVRSDVQIVPIGIHSKQMTGLVHFL